MVIPQDDSYRLREIEVMLALIGKALPHGLPEPRLQNVGENDWAESWKENFQVVRLGQHFVIKPSWRDYTPAPADLVIELDPGLAFGSGLHPTTRLCLQLFEELGVAGQTVFDVGTGSGILAIAALKLGAGGVRAVDVDDIAVKVAQENFERNGYRLAAAPSSGVQTSVCVPEKKQTEVCTPQMASGEVWVETAIGSAAENGGRQWQVVVANILASVLIELMPDLAAALAPQGQLILSGMIEGQDAEVASAAERYGLHIAERRTEEDWVALAVSR
jgi:ribosomal protein L11 methyltransferase